MTKLHQIIPVVTSKKSELANALTNAYHTLKKPEPFQGLIRNYAPLSDSDEMLPSEKKLVTTNVFKLYESISDQLGGLLKVVAAQERTNCEARTDVVVDGVTILSNISATYCLFLEKKLIDMATFISHIPVLDQAETWTYDKDLEAYRAEPKKTAKPKKVPVVITLAEATDHHPAQAQIVHEDKTVGYWTTTMLSGAVPVSVKTSLNFFNATMPAHIEIKNNAP